METTKPSRKRSKKPKLENFYKILGVRSNATQVSIKQKYIASVKAFPPETHPEEFQQIRRAYETLKDPLKRREYDLMRKYGGKLEKMMEDVWKHVENCQYAKAEALVNQVLELMPEDYNIHLILAQIKLLNGDNKAFYKEFALVEENASDQDKPMIMVVKARMLLEEDEAEAALQVLDQARANYPDKLQMFLCLYTDVYTDLDREDDLWEFALSLVPAPGTETSGDIFTFIYWLNTMIELEQWNFKSKIQQRLRKLLKAVKNEEDKLLITEALQDEHDGYFEAARFREAEIYMDFIYYIDSANPEVQKQRSKTQELMRVEKEIRKLEQEETIFPPISFLAMEWFYSDYLPPEELEYMSIDVPFLDSEAGDDLQIDEMYAQGIVALRKRYPLLYRYFQSDWEELFAERVQNLNREARRQLKL
ncbi:MAG: DnaJ domain-containing protein [Desulfosporosinus sp.]|nr:DnaJ domain-containing protein [Desulfosporosinus sp.]